MVKGAQARLASREMESLFNRYRNIASLLLVILAQLVLLAVQVKNDQDVRLIRVWSVTAVTPLARLLEGARSSTLGFLREYVFLRTAQEENQRLRNERDKLKMENQFLKAELSSAEMAKALSTFQSKTPSKTLASRVIMMDSGANSKVVFVDRGSISGVRRGMGVVTPDGIVGKVLAVYPTASQIQLVTDTEFAAGVVSQKSHVKGTLRGQGDNTSKVDFVPSEQKVEEGEWFYTSGDDRIFPRGFPAGVVRTVHPGSNFKEILIEPSGLRHGLEAMLILLEGVHQEVPQLETSQTPLYLGPAPPPDPRASEQTPNNTREPSGTAADRLLQRYKAIGAAQSHTFGTGAPGSKPPDFNMTLPPPPPPVATPHSGPAQQTTPEAPPPSAPAQRKPTT